MAVPAEDALLERPRAARAILQHLHVVVGFEDEDVRGADAVEHEPGGVAEVGGEADVAARGAQQKSDRILGVVRDGKGFDEDVGDLEARAGGEEVAVEVEPDWKKKAAAVLEVIASVFGIVRSVPFSSGSSIGLFLGLPLDLGFLVY